jgi:hypothetical protein
MYNRSSDYSMSAVYSNPSSIPHTVNIQHSYLQYKANLPAVHCTAYLLGTAYLQCTAYLLCTAYLQCTAHLKLGLLFPDMTLTNCWKVMADVDPENCCNPMNAEQLFQHCAAV